MDAVQMGSNHRMAALQLKVARGKWILGLRYGWLHFPAAVLSIRPLFTPSTLRQNQACLRSRLFSVQNRLTNASDKLVFFSEWRAGQLAASFAAPSALSFLSIPA